MTRKELVKLTEDIIKHSNGGYIEGLRLVLALASSLGYTNTNKR